jgi:PadR family transcriptional regulator, regulatory protein PadR
LDAIMHVKAADNADDRGGLDGGLEKWESQLRKGSLSLAVLATLCDGQLYGVEIRCRLEEIAGFTVVEGVIYPILRRLSKMGFVEAEWVEPEVGHPRRYFRLTPAGRRCVLELSRTWNEFAGGMNRMLAASDPRGIGAG